MSRGWSWLVALVILAMTVMFTCGATAADRHDALVDLRVLVGQEATEFLLAELQRVQPPNRIRRLARYQAFQDWLGAGFQGLLPDQLVDPQMIPVPEDEASLLETARVLARQRWINSKALALVKAPHQHWTGGFPRSLESSPTPEMHLMIDWSVVRAFLEAMGDGKVTIEEARGIARLPANREMIRAITNADRRVGPRMTEESLAVLIAAAGSQDPLDRLWCWLNPMNQFGYADIVMNEDRYRQMVADLDLHAGDISKDVLDRISLVAPPGIQMDVRFALTVAGLVQTWETNGTVGANVLQFNNDRDLLTATIAEGVTRHLLPRFCRTTTGERPVSWPDLVFSHLEDERYDKLFELIAATVLDGVAHLAGCPTCRLSGLPQATLGVEHIEDFIREVIRDCHVLAADEYLCTGTCEEGLLHQLGGYLARTVADHDGPGAIGQLLQKGPVAVLYRVREIEIERGSGVLSEELMSAVQALSVRLERDSGIAIQIEITG